MEQNDQVKHPKSGCPAKDEQSIRSAFIKKVFMILTAMFIMLAIMCSIPFFLTSFSNWVSKNLIFLWISVCVFIGVSLTLTCCQSLRRNFPVNLIALGIFTLASGYMTMAITAAYTIESVLIVFCITAGCSAAITIFSVFVKKDLTSMMGIAFILSIILLFFGISASIACLAFGVTFLQTVYACLASAVMMFYLAIDVQMIVGGRKYEISPEDYVFAALQIFLDILNIFLLLLSIFGKAK
uniref:Protein lifeguard 1 n=1 Tax=Heterorhabditis bacteriophora TaxID=37862 RepID=A0A1I7XFK2_HETBA